MSRVNTLEEIARTAHEVNRAYCFSIGDTSQLPWDDSPKWLRSSVRSGVEFHILNPDATPEDSHANWLAEKTEDGWVYGRDKNEELKTHPCCRPYGALPPKQRAKDALFIAVVKTMLEMKA